ncbi:P1 family peptidase [Demetria terragena]|uniref:P1 family peptidase n=1 Tax=Demetria terragena TaxID=63959 RepID=UPI0003AAD72F|nr:P1 family peptidase [Demetria terragena]
MSSALTGSTNSLHDVAGLRVGHAQRMGEGWLSGTTCVLAGDDGAIAGVDVRGGGPGTRETDALDPRNLVERVHAVVLTGGSAYGLDAAGGVMQRLEGTGIGLPIGGGVVPIVPTAVLFDLGRGGDFAARPDARMGAEAYDAAAAASSDSACAIGVIGAGTGAKAGGLKGGIGSASTVLPDGTTVAALVAVNALGSAVDPRTGELYATRFGMPGEFPAMGPADPEELAAARQLARDRSEQESSPTPYAMATTIGVVATDATLTKAQCQKMAGVGHDGLARAVNPVHTMFDGDTIFGLSTARRDPLDLYGFHDLLEAAGDCFTRAVGHAMLAAETVTGTQEWRSYRDALPSAFAVETSTGVVSKGN